MDFVDNLRNQDIKQCVNVLRIHRDVAEITAVYIFGVV